MSRFRQQHEEEQATAVSHENSTCARKLFVLRDTVMSFAVTEERITLSSLVLNRFLPRFDVVVERNVAKGEDGPALGRLDI